MAFNWQTFRTRSLTAIVFVIVMLFGLLWNRWSFFVLFSIVHAGAWIEFQKLVSKFHPEYNTISRAHKIGVIVAGWCIMLFFTNAALHIGSINFQIAGIWLGLALIVLLPLADLIKGNFHIPNIAYSITGLIYISLSLGLLIDLRNRWDDQHYQLSMTIPLLIIFSLWINDTMAYIVGSLIGRHPLSIISPKKTWEGTIGGIILTIVTMSLIANFTKRISITDAAIMAAIASITGTLGDLAESKLKRMAEVKDSGHIMPGHGGFLDRFDSLLFATVFVWFYAELFISA
jgi:phosphatidate cytidylyltransferase